MKAKVFILGAGASKPAGAPLVREFIGQGIFHLKNMSAFPDKLENYTYFLDFLKKKYGFDLYNQDPYKSDPFVVFKKTDIEQVLSSIEEEIYNGNKDLIKVRKEAVRFVYLTLENAIKGGPSKSDCYPAFVGRKIDTLNNDYAIIMFNYEILLERALPRGCFSYGIDVDRDKIINFPSYEKSYKNNLLILKLHGSLNWAFCSKCNKIYLFWSQRYDHIVKKTCKHCKTNLEAVLIPPTRHKSSWSEKLWKGADLEKLWEIARKKIISADEITIIGFSLGDFDVEALSLITNSINTNEKIPNLYIADPNAEEIYDKIISKTSVDKNHFNKISLFENFREYLNGILFRVN